MGLAVVGCIYGLASDNTTQDVMVLNSTGPLLTSRPKPVEYRKGNIALNKPSYLSSTALEGPPSRANDGILNNYAHTRGEGEVSPWWVVDLEEEIPVAFVTVHERKDCCQGRLTNYQITIGSSRNPMENPACPGFHGDKQKFIPCHMTGRYVGLV